MFKPNIFKIEEEEKTPNQQRISENIEIELNEIDSRLQEKIVDLSRLCLFTKASRKASGSFTPSKF